MLEGVLPVWKAEGMTSHDVVARARRILGMKRIGHTGTLDPMVTGALPLCLGRATRMVEYIQELPKSYEAKLILGVATDTEDMTGTVTERADPSRLRLEPDTITEAISSFLGEVEQVPPMYSAIKINGKRLYELAREGTVVPREPRRVRIYEIKIVKMELELELPEVTIRVTCSKGTYIRTLCVDIGRKLNIPAAMGHLVRTSTGGISADRCHTLESIAEAKLEGRLEQLLIPTDRAVDFLPQVELLELEAKHALQGKTIRPSADLTRLALRPELPLVRVYDPAQAFLGLFRVHPETGTLVPEKVFLPDGSGCQE